MIGERETRTLNEAWIQQLSDVMHYGKEVSPRGKLTKELPQKTMVFDMNYPVVTYPSRKMGYKFMAAEAWWMLEGRNDVQSIARYSMAISNFSDDGVSFFGAYGPRIKEQMHYVCRTLMDDIDTRQAVLTMWRPNPPRSKDIPCTVAFSFMIRDGKLNLHVFMRSSDNWLGIPYDAFNFTMVACEVLRRYNMEMDDKVGLGSCYLTAASSHIYETNFKGVQQVFQDREPLSYAPVPKYMYGIYEGPLSQYYTTTQYLKILKDVDKDESVYRWWA